MFSNLIIAFIVVRFVCVYMYCIRYFIPYTSVWHAEQHTKRAIGTWYNVLVLPWCTYFVTCYIWCLRLIIRVYDSSFFNSFFSVGGFFLHSLFSCYFSVARRFCVLLFCVYLSLALSVCVYFFRHSCLSQFICFWASAYNILVHDDAQNQIIIAIMCMF